MKTKKQLSRQNSAKELNAFAFDIKITGKPARRNNYD